MFFSNYVHNVGNLGDGRKYLKVKLKSLTTEAKYSRIEESKVLRFCRYLMQKQSFKHKKDTPKPELQIFKEFENAQSLYDASYETYWNLGHRRKTLLRKEARCVMIAYGILRDVPYSKMECKSFSFPDLRDIQRLVVRYGSGGHNDVMSKFEKWKTEAEAHYKEKGNLNPKSPEKTI